jgi:hypothetical protein
MKGLLASMSVLASFAVLAADPPPTRVNDRPLTKEEARFRALDANNDRKLSDVEFQADTTAPTEFASLDENGDGFISLSEFLARPIPPAPTR